MSSYNDIKSNLHRLIRYLSEITIVSTAHADPVFQAPTTILTNVGPTLVAALYGILLLGYVVSMIAWFFGPPASRRSAAEYVKLLTTFFIGTLSGKLA